MDPVHDASGDGRASGQRSEALVARSTNALLAEILSQTNDAVAASEVRDVAAALALLAPLTSPTLTRPASLAPRPPDPAPPAGESPGHGITRSPQGKEGARWREKTCWLTRS